MCIRFYACDYIILLPFPQILVAQNLGQELVGVLAGVMGAQVGVVPQHGFQFVPEHGRYHTKVLCPLDALSGPDVTIRWTLVAGRDKHPPKLTGCNVSQMPIAYLLRPVA
jgi:hypothetical protein